MAHAVEMLKVTKAFPGVLANDQVDFTVQEGEIHGLIGENGAGKSTLMNILYGLYAPDSGEIRIHGKAVKVNSPHEAIQLGIGMVHQHFMLVPSLPVIDNIILGKTPVRAGLNDYKTARAKVQSILQQYSLKIDLDAKVFQLSVGQMQRVEIIKALYRGARILILDEPTAVLTPQETEDLFAIMRELASQGCSIIFITHKLREVLAVTQQITVMRRGVVTGKVETRKTDKVELANMMVGRSVVLRVEKPPAKVTSVALEVQGLSARNERDLPALKDVSFQVRRGEIVGIAGVEGNGQTELVEVISGLRAGTSGRVTLDGADITHASVRARRLKGLAHIPENRLLVGVSKTCSIQDNLILDKYFQNPLSRWQLLNPAAIGSFARKLVQDYGIKTTDPHMLTESLSGGNMQKVVLARELDSDPGLLVAAQPTRGVDVGAIEYIHKQLIALRDRDRAILLVSAELDEIMTLADRILVFYEGEIVGEFQGGQVTENELGLYMTGAKRAEVLPAAPAGH